LLLLEFLISSRRKLNVCPACLLGLLLKTVEYIDAFRKLRNIEDTEDSMLIPYPDLTNPLTDARHRFPVAGIAAFLNEGQLLSCPPPCGFRKIAKRSP
jgi:hypothetical protein